MNEENTLFLRNVKDGDKTFDKDSSSEDEDIWDDTLLIKAYDKAVEIAKKDFLEKKSVNNEGNSKSIKKKWKIGDKCRCKYSEDLNYYEAEILDIDKSSGKCTVKYVGYENEETVFLKNLKQSEGETARQEQMLDAAYEDKETEDSHNKNNRLYSESSQNSSKKRSASKNKNPSKQKNGFGSNIHSQFSFPFPQTLNSIIPPPPPPHLFRNLCEDESETEAMSAMLISWYMNGYHTGYYQGLKMAKKQ